MPLRYIGVRIEDISEGPGAGFGLVKIENYQIIASKALFRVRVRVRISMRVRVEASGKHSRKRVSGVRMSAKARVRVETLRRTLKKESFHGLGLV